MEEAVLGLGKRVTATQLGLSITGYAGERDAEREHEGTRLEDARPDSCLSLHQEGKVPLNLRLPACPASNTTDIFPQPQ